MIISGFQKLTLLDYPGVVSCIIFTSGCNLRCPFCHNSSLLERGFPEVLEEEILAYLEKRKGILDGVVISGGEPLLQKDIETFIKKIKDMGYKIKLDTNGTNPEKLKELIDKGLLDYVAMDIKNIFSKYEVTTGKSIKSNAIIESINTLKKKQVDYEFRTTLVKEFHTKEDIVEICKLIEDSKYYLQNFKNGDGVLDKSLHGFEEDELKRIFEELKKEFPTLELRGI